MPIAETLGVFDELVAAGHVGAYGRQQRRRRELEARARAAAALRVGAELLLAARPRAPSARCCRSAREHGLGFTPFSPLAGGWLTGKYRRDEPPPEGSRMTMRPEPYRHLDDDRVYDGLDGARRAAARARGATLPQLAFAWLLVDPRVTAVVVGPRRPEQLEPALAALDLQLSASERDGSLAQSRADSDLGRGADQRRERAALVRGTRRLVEQSASTPGAVTTASISLRTIWCPCRAPRPSSPSPSPRAAPARGRGRQLARERHREAAGVRRGEQLLGALLPWASPIRVGSENGRPSTRRCRP